jgi:hypothetical protein
VEDEKTIPFLHSGSLLRVQKRGVHSYELFIALPASAPPPGSGQGSNEPGIGPGF